MFILQNINTLRGVLPTHEYKQILHKSDQILFCLNTDLTCKKWNEIILKSGNYTPAKKRRMVIASACYELLSLAHDYRILRTTMHVAKNEIKMLKRKIELYEKENVVMINPKPSYDDELRVLRKSTIEQKKEQLRKLKFDKTTKAALINFLYTEIIDMINTHQDLIMPKRG